MTVTTVRLQPEVETGLETMVDKLHRSKKRKGRVWSGRTFLA